MVPPILWRCPRTPYIIHPLKPRPRLHNFTTTPPLPAKPLKPKGPPPSSKMSPGKQRTQSSKLRIKKAPIVVQKPAYDVGQRKELRKRIVLSNTNAIPVVLPTMTSDLIGNEEAAGAMFALPGGEGDTIVDRLRVLGAFQTKQHWPFFHHPCTLFRRETVEVGKLLERVMKREAAGEDGKANERAILHGYYGCGRSILLLQAMTWALQKGWVVIAIPNAQDLVVGHTEYELEGNSHLWLQKAYTTDLLNRVLRANQRALEQMKLSQKYRLGRMDEVQKGDAMKGVLEAAVLDPLLAWDAFNVLLGELGLPGSPLVLFTLDNLNQISIPSKYRDPAFNAIHPHDLALPNTFLAYLSGKRSFHTGITLAATSSKCSRTLALDAALEGREVDPYEKLDPRIGPSIEGAQIIHVGSLSKREAKALMDYYNESGIMKDPVDIATFNEKFAVSAGNPRDLFGTCLRVRQ
ncbi:mitochondrial ribosomal death-associated protein 3-domain-containing protein [Tuber brumale]|nr:mitochondrial ribosomal death-associated protein 3-domain-containing protein [Tuber brumale]